MSRTLSTSVNVDVDVDFDDVDIEDLIEYIEENGYAVKKISQQSTEDTNRQGAFSQPFTAWDFAQLAVRDIAQCCRKYEDVKGFYHDLIAEILHVSQGTETDVLLEKLKELL